MTSVIIDSETARTDFHGSFAITAQLPVDAGFAINVFYRHTGERVAPLCFTFYALDDANHIHRVIREHADAGHTAEEIGEHVMQALIRIANRYRGRAGYGPRVDNLDRAMDQLDTVTAADLDRLADALYGSVL